MDILSELISKRPSRRRFLAGAGAAGAATLVAGCSSSTPAPTTPTTPATPVADADILTFALNLEYLEAEFYLRAVTGSGLSAADNSSSAQAAGSVNGGTKVSFQNPVVAAYAAEISANELAHVRFLRSALTAAGITPMSAPTIDFTNAFAAAATAANVVLAAGQTTFNPFADDTSFLLGAFLFEDVGVTAYTGAASLIRSKAYLNAAAGIQAVEAYHAAEIRTFIANLGGSALSNANLISGLRATLGGGGETPLVPGNSTTAATIANADPNGLAYGRSFDQVLHIVYATGNGAGVRSGGFFPNGLNGNVTITAS